MSARSPRRSFATPFVVTLATAAPLAACHVQATARTTASGGSQPQPVEATPTNPPRPVEPGPNRAPEPAPAPPPIATSGTGGVTTGPAPTPTRGPDRVITNPPVPTAGPATPTAKPPTPNTAPANPATTATTGGKPTPQGGKPVPQGGKPTPNTAPANPATTATTDGGSAPAPQGPRPPTPVNPGTIATTDVGGKVTPQGGKPVPPSVKPGPVPVDYVPAAGAAVSVDVHWIITNNGGMCVANAMVNCPAPVPGQPVMSCNPPAPQKVACPPGVAAGASTKVIKRANQTTCYVDTGPMSCPKGAICNPPPPRRVACPS